MTDNGLIKKYAQGDTSALEELINKYQAPLYSYIFSFMKNEETSADILQDVFLKLVESPDKYKEGNLKAWLYTVSRNKCMDAFRAGAKANVSLDAEIEDGLTVGDTLPSAEKTPLNILIENADSKRLYEIIDSIPPAQKEVVLLRQEMSFKEIAALLGCPIGSVLSRASRGYKQIKFQLEAANDGR